jgi:hypothetical protein
VSKGKPGAIVIYCGHEATFVADIWVVGNVNVVRANGPIEKQLNREEGATELATHHLSDFPQPGFWRPDLGVFVVPQKQVSEIKRK